MTSQSTQSELEEFARLDAAGYLIGRDEGPEAYRLRLRTLVESEARLTAALESSGSAEPFPGVRVTAADRIPAEILEESAQVTDALYAFRVDHVPGFFLSGDVGLLWGGCLLSDTESPLAIFLIRSSFRTRKRFFIYNRRELMAHELCHSARHRLCDPALEEFFAYRTSPSPLRRYLGNCFISQLDALLFLFPTLLLLAMQMLQSFWLPGWPVWPFWILALGYPAFLLIRNACARAHVFRTAQRLRAFGIRNPWPILFRLTWDEIGTLRRLGSPAALREWVEARGRGNLRWRVLAYRFFKQEEAGE